MDIDANNYDTWSSGGTTIHNGKDASRLVSQLKEKDQSNFVADYKQREADFERLCQITSQLVLERKEKPSVKSD